MARHARWYVNIRNWNPSQHEWLKLTSSITREEVDRINKYVYKEDSKSSLVGQALIRRFVSIALNKASNEVLLDRTERGRPQVSKDYVKQSCSSWPKIFDFNVSHSGDYCVLAGIWSDREISNPGSTTIGVDVTKIVKKASKSELNRFLDLMSRREFTREEWSTIEMAQSDRQKCINFTRLWCLKESFIKSNGLGLSFKLNRIDFRWKENIIETKLPKNTLINNTIVLLDGKQASDWHFIETALDEDHLVAIGYNSEREHVDTKVAFQEVSIDTLIDSLKPINSPNQLDWVRFSSRETRI